MRRRTEKQTCHILVEGDSEDIYFNALRQREEFKSKYQITVENCSGQDKLLNVALNREKRNELQSKYDRVIVVLDKDHATREELRRLCECFGENNVGFTNPKIEYWLLAHLEVVYDNYSAQSVDKKLLKKLPNYKKNSPRIADFIDKLDDAIKNTKNVTRIDFDNSSTNLALIIQSLSK